VQLTSLRCQPWPCHAPIPESIRSMVVAIGRQVLVPHRVVLQCSAWCGVGDVGNALRVAAPGHGAQHELRGDRRHQPAGLGAARHREARQVINRDCSAIAPKPPNPQETKIQRSSVLPTRKPKSRNRLSVELPSRKAERRFSGTRPQEPPRRTRSLQLPVPSKRRA
jgi:hypothetical protein